MQDQQLAEGFHNYTLAVDAVYFDWPLVASVLNLDELTLSWQMEYSERAALVFVLQNLHPVVAVEVGTHSGGSLAALSRFSERVYSLDILPESSELLRERFSNVDFVVGNSKETLPPILRDIQANQEGPLFVLIDGDHSAAGAYADLTNVLTLRPSYPIVVMAHDSFNPDVRAGMLEVSWAKNPFLHYVEIDFQHGSIYNRLGHRMQMWGGLALAVLLPDARKGEVVVSRRHELLFQIVLPKSAHRRSRLSQGVRAIRRRLPF